MGGGPGGDGRDDKDKKVRSSMEMYNPIDSKTSLSEGQAQIRATSSTYYSPRTEET